MVQLYLSLLLFYLSMYCETCTFTYLFIHRYHNTPIHFLIPGFSLFNYYIIEVLLSPMKICAHTKHNILEGKPKPYIFYPVDKNPKNKSTKITKLATTCLTYNLDNMAMLPIC